MTDQIVSTLRQSLRGRLIGPSDFDYDAASALYNGMIDKRPAPDCALRGRRSGRRTW